MVFGLPIARIATIAIVGVLAASFFKDAFAQGLGKTISEVGTGGQAIGGALSSIGTGAQGFLTGIGVGTAQLLNPLFTLKDLAGPIVGVASGGVEAVTGTGTASAAFSDTGAIEKASAVAANGAPSMLTTQRGSLSITDMFQRITSGLSIRGTPLAPTAISRTQPTYGGILSTPTGGSREIRGSEALFARLASNLAR